MVNDDQKFTGIFDEIKEGFVCYPVEIDFDLYQKFCQETGRDPYPHRVKSVVINDSQIINGIWKWLQTQAKFHLEVPFDIPIVTLENLPDKECDV